MTARRHALYALLIVAHSPWFAAGPGSFGDAFLRAAGLSNALDDATVRAFLGRIECPTLYVAAKEGIPGMNRAAAERGGSIRDLTQVLVEGAHHVHMDHPERVAAHLAPFLAAV